MSTATTNRITKIGDRCGGEACVRDTRLTVYGLVEWRRNGKSDAWLLANYPSLSADDLIAAWDYATEHAAEIDAAIERNREA